MPTNRPDPGNLAEIIDVDQDDFWIVIGMRVNVTARFQQALVGDRVGQPHDLRAEPVLYVQYGASGVSLCLCGERNATVRKDIADEPPPDVGPLRPLYLSWQNGAELEKVSEEHRRALSQRNGEQDLG